MGIRAITVAPVAAKLPPPKKPTNLRARPPQSTPQNVLVRHAQVIVDAASTVALTLASEVALAVMRHEGASQIATGIGCMLGGGYMMLKGSMCSAARSIIQEKEVPKSMTACKAITCAAGLGLLAGGVSCIISGLKSCFSEPEKIAPPVIVIYI